MPDRESYIPKVRNFSRRWNIGVLGKSAQALGAILLAFGNSHAAPIAEDNFKEQLIERSPFIPAGQSFSAEEDVTIPLGNRINTSDLTIRALYQLDGKYRFFIFDESENSGEWVYLGETSNSYRVTEFDVQSMKATLEWKGQITHVALASVALPTGNYSPIVSKGNSNTPDANQQGSTAHHPGVHANSFSHRPSIQSSRRLSLGMSIPQPEESNPRPQSLTTYTSSSGNHAPTDPTPSPVIVGQGMIPNMEKHQPVFIRPRRGTPSSGTSE